MPSNQDDLHKSEESPKSNEALSVNNFLETKKTPLYTLTSTDTLISTESGDVVKEDPVESRGIVSTMRRWLVVPICFLYGGGLVTMLLVAQQYVLV